MNLLPFALERINETLAAAIVILAASILLYNVTRNLNNRIARTSAILLGCVTITYIADVFVSLGPDAQSYEAVLRGQWLGIAFMPAAHFHLSDALLATTGLPSRGRRRRVVRLMYVISAVLLFTATATDWLIQPMPIQGRDSSPASAISLNPGPAFPVYVTYFLVAVGAAFINVQRARLRCLAPSTRRRMGYLQFAMLTPAVGIFPFSIILGAGTEFTSIGLILVNLANLLVILMLLFLAYPLSFFGSSIPDRVVKTELLRFILRGPGTALLSLAVYVFTNATTQILGLAGEDFTPFATVSMILLWQWGIALSLPWLERRLIYDSDDAEQLEKLQNLSERLLTRADLMQLLEALLASACDYLRASSAFVAAYSATGLDLVRAVGPIAPSRVPLGERGMLLRSALNGGVERAALPLLWEGYWVVPLNGERGIDDASERAGVLAIEARDVELTDDERQQLAVFAERAEQALEDMNLQTEIFAALEGLLPQIHLTRKNTDSLEYRSGYSAPVPQPASSTLLDRDQFNAQVRAALKHYWGGPGLTNSRLLELEIVNKSIAENDGSPIKALRDVLGQAIERLKPEGEPKPLDRAWTLYTIIELRFLKGQRVREVANRLAMSEPDFFRKQNAAIDSVAEQLWDMEHRA